MPALAATLTSASPSQKITDKEILLVNKGKLDAKLFMLGTRLGEIPWVFARYLHILESKLFFACFSDQICCFRSDDRSPIYSPLPFALWHCRCIAASVVTICFCHPLHRDQERETESNNGRSCHWDFQDGGWEAGEQGQVRCQGRGGEMADPAAWHCFHQGRIRDDAILPQHHRAGAHEEPGGKDLGGCHTLKFVEFQDVIRKKFKATIFS